MPSLETRLRLLEFLAELCAIFMRDFNAQPGWACYPETGGFDVLVAHESGRQIGVEAKLQLNAKVADQILPDDNWFLWAKCGPDHRLVIVRSITEANAGIAKMLQQLGVSVWAPHMASSYRDGSYVHVPQFFVSELLYYDSKAFEPPGKLGYHHAKTLFDWSPEQRIALPELPPTTAAGVPSPIQMTPWKQAAIRVLARLRAQGFLTAKDISAEGISPSMWTQRWLVRGEVRGQWLQGAGMATPAFRMRGREPNYLRLEFVDGTPCDLDNVNRSAVVDAYCGNKYVLLLFFCSNDFFN